MASPYTSDPPPAQNKAYGYTIKTLVAVIIGCTVALSAVAIIVVCIVVFGGGVGGVWPDEPEIGAMYAASGRCNNPKEGFPPGGMCMMYPMNWAFNGEQQKCIPIGEGCAELANHFRTKSACEGACGGGQPRNQMWYHPQSTMKMYTYDSRKISGVGDACIFPFEYKGRFYTSCIATDSPYAGEWCATKWTNYTFHRQRGECYPQYEISTGGICKFPFWVNGRWYTGCVGLALGQYPWCSVTRVFEGKRSYCGAEAESQYIPKPIDCEAPANENYCFNGGTCFTYNDTSEMFCLCPTIFQGLLCDEDFNIRGRIYTEKQAAVLFTPCVETGRQAGMNYCFHGGTCLWITAFAHVANVTRICVCTSEWEGHRCSRKLRRIGVDDRDTDAYDCTPLWQLRRNLLMDPHGPVISNMSPYGCKYACMATNDCKGFNYNRMNGSCSYITQPVRRMSLKNGLVNFELASRCHSLCKTSMFYRRENRRVVRNTDINPLNVGVGEGRHAANAIECVNQCARTPDCVMVDFFRESPGARPSCHMFAVMAMTATDTGSNNYILVSRCWAENRDIYDRGFNATRGVLCTKQTFCRNGGTCVMHPTSDTISGFTSMTIIERESEYAGCVCPREYTGPRCGERLSDEDITGTYANAPPGWENTFRDQ